MGTARLPCPKIARGQQQLLPEQETYLHGFFQERYAALYACTPINEHEAEEHLYEAYRVLGLEAPRIRWFDSPLAFVAAYAPQWVSNSSGTEIGTSIQSRIEALAETVWFAIWEGTSEAIWDQVQESTPDSSAWGSMGNSIWRQVYNEIRVYNAKAFWRKGSSRGEAPWRMQRFREDEIWESVYWDPEKVAEIKNLTWRQRQTQDQTWRALEETIARNWFWQGDVRDIVRAYQEEDRLVCFRFFHEVYAGNALIHLARLNELVSGYHLGDAEAWLTRKPVRLERDAQGRLHSADGMCIQYRDGLGLYAWHGVRVPERIIKAPETLTRQDFLSETNVEVRRIIEERLGSERFIALLGGRCIDQSRRGKLVEIELPDDPERVAHYLQVRDSSTNRRYYLRVPPSVMHADEAAAWTFGLDAATYQPDQET
jgi:hypothetical protein